MRRCASRRRRQQNDPVGMKKGYHGASAAWGIFPEREGTLLRVFRAAGKLDASLAKLLRRRLEGVSHVSDL